MHYFKRANLILAILVLWFTIGSCRLPKYQHPSNTTTITTSEHLSPTNFGTKKYTASIHGSYGIKKYSLSGLLILKQLDDSTIRAVFQNEVGLTLFDFEWNKQYVFKVVSIIPQMNKTPLILALKKDFEILMQLQLNATAAQISNHNTTSALHYPLARGFVAYEVANKKIQSIKVYNTGKTYITFTPSTAYEIASLPDEMVIKHHKAKFTITLKSLEDYAPATE